MDQSPETDVVKQSKHPPVIYWTDRRTLGGNPWRVSPCPEMLLTEGFTLDASFRRSGRKTGFIETTKSYRIRYDRSYVVAWIKHEFVDRFPGITHVQARQLLVDALKMREHK